MRAEEDRLARVGSLRASRRGDGAFRRPGVALTVAALAAAACLGVLALYPGLARSLPWYVSSWLGYVLSWLPLIAGVVIGGVLGGGRGSVVTSIGLRWRPFDLLLGLGVGLALRSLIEFIAPTSADIGDSVLEGTVVENPAQWVPYLVGIGILVIAACVVGPVIEESLFRGVAQPALWQLTDGLGTSAVAQALRGSVAIAGISIAFSAMHVLAAPWPPTLGTTAATLGVGVGCGVLALTTKRLGGAIVAHAVFNASGLAIAYLS